MNLIENVSRRSFLKGMVSTGALVVGACYYPQLLRADGLPKDTLADRATLHPNVFVGIDTDGTVYIVAHRSEMGTGIRTSLPLVVADELDADWKRVKIEQAIGDPRYGDQNTDGSHSIRSFYDVMRQAGATARLMLIQAAAQRWNVAPAQCMTEPHVVVHRPTGRRLAYGELAASAAKLPVPKKEELQFKSKSSWRYIGKSVPSYDLENLCNGKAIYGMDAHIDGMVYASIEHPPVLGGKVKSYDDKEALKVSGVRQTIALDPFKPPPAFQPLGGVAVIADNTWSAFQGRKKLKVVWDNGPTRPTIPRSIRRNCRRRPANLQKLFAAQETWTAFLPRAAKSWRLTIMFRCLPILRWSRLVALADFRDGKLTAWAPTQNPQAVQDIVSKELGIAKENVICHVTLLGGGFGRKSKPDYVAEAAVLSKKIGRPVKVVWTREDDVKFDYYNAVAAMYMRAALGADGKPTAWLQRSVFPPITSIFDVDAVYGDPGHLQQGWTDVPFDIPNLRVENGPAQGARAHRLVALGGQYLSCLCRAIIRR